MIVTGSNDGNLQGEMLREHRHCVDFPVVEAITWKVR